MKYYEVAPTIIIRTDRPTFTYASETPLPIGAVVEIEAGKKRLPGIVMEEVSEPSYATKPVDHLIEPTPLPRHLVDGSRWISEYYATPLATVLQTVLPRGLLKNRRKTSTTTSVHNRQRTTIVLNDDQRYAVETIAAMSPGTALLHGVTGSGKTAVYIEAARSAVAAGQSVIILVPEISLTSQLVAEFAHHFNDILVTHSRQTEAERHLLWKTALTATTPQVVIGPRSALFMPVPKLGLIVIDECHEPSFKQEQSPRYSALRVASTFAGLAAAKLVMGSATPLISDYFIAKQSGRPIITMPKPAAKDTVKPSVSIVDMTKRSSFKRHRFLSDKLLSDLDQTFTEQKQALIFHNRRGSASTTLCENCGWQAGCPRCFVPLTLHADHHLLRCHICGFTAPVPTSCPECHHADIIHKGIGTKLIESELRKLFPDKTIVRFDGDNDSTESVDALYSKLYGGAIDLIIGTQVIAKGLDLPNLRTVGVVQADAGLSLPDFGAPERTFQLLAQVIGRVGRSHHPTRVIVQSYQPTHPAVVDGINQNYAEFYERTLALRRHSNFPPFCYLLKLTCVYKTEATAVKNARQLAETLKANHNNHIQVLGPAPAFYERTRDTYRWQLVIKADRRQTLLDLLPLVPPQHWQFELDPLSLL